MTTEGRRRSVVVVDDEEKLTELFAEWLRDEYDVTTATSGGEALELIDDDTDVVLLDRNMPDMSGDEVVDRLRARDCTCYVALVTVADPDFDILDVEFDDYITKPVDRERLLEAVDSFYSRAKYDVEVRELFRLLTKRERLEATLPREHLEASQEYEALLSRLDAAWENADKRLETILESDESAFDKLLQ